jgi:GTP-binding protein HflX
VRARQRTATAFRPFPDTPADPPGQQPERAVLVGVERQYSATGPETLDELGRLLETAGGQEVGRLHVIRERPDPATFIGRGKLLELAGEVTRCGAELVVFDDELSPAQTAKVERVVGVRVIDRSALILDLFARRARTREARTQVEMARLRYLLPRLTRRWSHLGRQVGGIGVRGEGEKQLEVDRRLLRRRIQRLRAELLKIDRARGERRKRRSRAFQVALVGYTNAGKTSLFNALTGSRGGTEDRLFATLDPLVRPLRRGGRSRTLLIDTVGFVRKLPHTLVASFRSTLREAAQADLLVHVIDPSVQEYEQQMETAHQVLAELDLAEAPSMDVFTKIDRVSEPGSLERLRRLYPQAALVSSVTGEGLNELAERIVRTGTVEESVLLSAGDGGALARLRREVDIVDTVYHGNQVEVRYRVARQWAERARRAVVGEA